MTLTDLSNDALVSGLMNITGQSRELLAQLLAYLGEMDARKLYRDMGCSSMFTFCVERLHFSEGGAWRRIAAARAARAYPMILDAVASGDLNLTNVELLVPHLTRENHAELLRSAFRKKKNEVQAIVAARNPNAPERHNLQIAISRELRDKIERARGLMRHRNPSGDLAVVVEQAIDLLLAKLEKDRAKASNGIPRAVRQATFERDGGQCTYVSPDGHRCTEHGFLEIDHCHPRGLGGSDDPSNLRVLCRAHNLLLAEQAYGRAYVEKKIHLRQRKQTSSTSTSTLACALKNLGFRDVEIRRATNTLAGRFAEDAPIETLVREALALLTPS